MARAVAKSVMKARICAQSRCARGGCAAAPSAPAGPYLSTTERAQQGVYLIDLWSFQLVFLTIPFVFKTSWPHDFVFLPFTQALLVWWLLEGEKVAPGTDSAGKRPHAIVYSRARTAVTLTLLLPSIAIANIVFFVLFGDFRCYGFYGFLFWANLLLLLAMYVQLLPRALQRVQ